MSSFNQQNGFHLEPRSGHMFATYKGSLMVAGGYTSTGPILDVCSLSDHTRNQWNKIYPTNYPQAYSPAPRIETTPCLCDDKIIIFGGITFENDEVNILNELIEFNLFNQHWSLVYDEVDLISERSNHITEKLSETSILIHGGHIMGTTFEDAFIYDVGSHMITEIVLEGAPSPHGRFNHSSCHINNGNVAIFGGAYTSTDDTTHETVYLEDLWIFSIEKHNNQTNMRWTQIIYNVLKGEISISPRDGAAMTCYDKKVFIYGGYGLVERFDDDGGGNEGKRTGDVNEDGEVIIASSPSADNVYEEYLSDLWSIDLRTGRCSQRELLEEVGLGPARGGAIVIIPSPAEIIITPSSADIPMREEAIQPSEDKESASLTVLALGGFNETINEDTNGISTSESQFLDFRSSTIANTIFIS